MIKRKVYDFSPRLYPYCRCRVESRSKASTYLWTAYEWESIPDEFFSKNEPQIYAIMEARTDDIRRCIIPTYRKVTDIVHEYEKPFVLHSGGNTNAVIDVICRLLSW